ncbi:MAG: hypothetical protein B6D59_06610 [Campylobacteraceae bacterium 4484_4]|nr:MAG: hypothetical protein B6D59_06610 [Campylobacteraceae bacterium 4484_4]
MNDRFQMPPLLTNEAGEERRIGFEIEFGGLGIDEASSLIQSYYGGKIRKINPFKCKIESTRWGTFTIELDMRLLNESLLQERLRELGIEEREIIDMAQSIVGTLSETIVPFEIATPPLPLSQIHIMEEIENALRLQGAKGTGASWIYAFGLHINPEVPSFKASSILAYLRAFLLLSPWIQHRSGTDLMRKLSPFIIPFEKEYTTFVLDSAYHPSLKRLIRDYLLYNPTRNRPLDLLPLFMYLHPEILESTIKNEKIKARPTYHYRLPNSRIDEPDWHICDEWNRWVEIEKLANDRHLLREMSLEYLEYVRRDPLFFEAAWVENVERWMA